MKFPNHPPLVECVQAICDENVERIRLDGTALPAGRDAPAATGFLLDIVKDRNQAVQPPVDRNPLRARAAVGCTHRQETGHGTCPTAARVQETRGVENVGEPTVIHDDQTARRPHSVGPPWVAHDLDCGARGGRTRAQLYSFRRDVDLRDAPAGRRRRFRGDGQWAGNRRGGPTRPRRDGLLLR
ncbi:hypothetical protein THAOC_29021, partial [Thalassiosira oceanica]